MTSDPGHCIGPLGIHHGGGLMHAWVVLTCKELCFKVISRTLLLLTLLVGSKTLQTVTVTSN